MWDPDGQNGYANPDGTAVNVEQADGRVVEYIVPPAAVTVLRGVVLQCLVEPRHFYVSGYLMGSTMRLSGSGLLRYFQARAELSTKGVDLFGRSYGCCMSDRVLLSKSLIVIFLLAASSQGQKGNVGVFNPINTSPLGSQGGLLVTVVGEGSAPLDRQAVVKASAKSSENVVWQTTDRMSQAALGELKVGTYDIEVSAVGYLTSTIEAKITAEHTVYQVRVSLKKDPAAIEISAPSQTQLPVKVRKEISQGVADLKSGKLKSAQKHLAAANDMVPSNADVEFLLGYLYLQEKDFKSAEKYLSEASSLDSHNIQALTLLGRVQIEKQDYSAASKALERAITVDPDYWMAHSLLADTYLKQQDYEKAREQALVAINTGKGAGIGAEIALGQALENLGRVPEALEAYKRFVQESPSSPLAPQVRNMYNDLSRQSNGGKDVAWRPSSASTRADVLLAASQPLLSTRTWGPPSIDDVKPSMAAGVACPADQVLDSAGARVKELVDDLGKFDAIEDVVHEDLDPLDHPITRAAVKFNYVASISEPRPGFFEVSEFRDQRSGPEDFPDQIATRGLPTLALTFHPDERDDFEMTCEGLGDWRGHATWLVRFQQREGKPHVTQEYKIGGIAYPVSLKGRAWISADTFHIVHLESDLVSPMPEIQLLSEHMAVDYAPVLFQKKNVQLWLPKSAELYFDFRRHHYLRRHSFDHFMLFSVDSEEKRSEPSASKKEIPSPVTVQ